MTDDAKPGFKSAADLPEDVRDHLGTLILCLADNKRVLGIRYADWMLGAPSVEAGIACSAMAQDEWGHGRILYSMLKDFGYDPSALEHEREASEYRNLEIMDSDVSSWPELLALNFLLDSALSTQFEMLVDSRFEPIHYKVRKLLDEERFHFDHGHGWTQRLMSVDSGKGAMTSAFEHAFNAVTRWFGPDDDPVTGSLAEHGIVRGSSGDTRGAWLERVGGVLADLSVATPDPDWAGWSAERRRAEAGGPDEDTLARVRGDRNRTLLMD